MNKIDNAKHIKNKIDCFHNSVKEFEDVLKEIDSERYKNVEAIIWEIALFFLCALAEKEGDRIMEINNTK